MKAGVTEPKAVNIKLNKRLAILSFVLGILGLLIWFLHPPGVTLVHPIVDFGLPAVGAFVLGLIALTRMIRSSNFRGIGFAIAGLFLSWPMAMFAILGTIFTFVKD